jgi:hypothetical protein
VSKHLTQHGRENHIVQVVRLPLGVPQTQSALLAFEQYLFLRLNPSINFLFIAGSSFISEQEAEKMRQEQGRRIYVYYRGTLVAQTATVQGASNLLGITRWNVRVAASKDSYLGDFKVTYVPVPGATVSIMEQSELTALLNKHREGKVVYLYIDGQYIGTYTGLNEVCAATGFTKAQIAHAQTRSGGVYHPSSNIMFSPIFLENMPTQTMTKAEILEHCTNARNIVSNRNSVYLYRNNNLIGKFQNITKAYNACSELSIGFKAVCARLSRNGKCINGEYLFSKTPI